MKVLIIKWRDAHWDDNIFNAKKAPGLCTMITAGIFVREDKNCIVVSEDFWVEHGDWFRNTTAIPKKGIISIKKIRIPESFLEGRGADRE